MARAKYQVLVIPYCALDKDIKFCVFKRSDSDVWQFIAGGGEDSDKTITDTAKREALEEAGIDPNSKYVRLDTCCSIPANCFKDHEKIWGKDCFVIPEYSFGVEVDAASIALSHEHTEYKWAGFDDACSMLKYDSNKTALWELSRRIELEII